MPSDDFIAVRERIDPVALVEDLTQSCVAHQSPGDVRLTPCPFCNSKTGFSVNPETKTYYCHHAGCGAQGDVFTFVMQLKGLTRKYDALKFLADRVGHELPKSGLLADDRLDAILRLAGEVKRVAAEYYAAQLWARRDEEFAYRRNGAEHKATVLGYQTGTGVMIGLPGQRTEQLADDLLFFREFGVDMIGMGPYVEHRESPMSNRSKQLRPDSERFEMTRKMVAVLRLMMPDINIAATTASEALVPQSREMLIASGANVIMPNITPLQYQGQYDLYSNKPNTHYDPKGDFKSFSDRINALGYVLTPEEWGDSQHFHKKIRDCIV